MTKKIISLIVILLLLFFTLNINVYAQSIPLGSFEVTLSKEKIMPGQEVTVNVNFGESLGAYTVDVAYDNKIFEYVSVDGGTENDNSTRVRVTYYDSTGGSNPRTNMSVTFKAKEELEATNLSDFSVTAEGLSNSDASQDYDDITSPVKKSITVEPDYKEYKIALNYTGDIIKDTEKDMELVTSSSMGKNYDHVKMKVEITNKPSDDATVKLLATERTRQEIDLVTDGWGEPTGYELGGKDAKQVLDIRGLFSQAGNYKIKISLLDKDTSDAEIASQEFDITVKETAQIDNEGNEDNTNGNQNNTIEGEEQNTINDNNENTSGNGSNTENVQNEMPETLPKTGMTQYIYFITAIAILGTGYIALRNFKKDK